MYVERRGNNEQSESNRSNNLFIVKAFAFSLCLLCFVVCLPGLVWTAPAAVLLGSFNIHNERRTDHSVIYPVVRQKATDDYQQYYVSFVKFV